MCREASKVASGSCPLGGAADPPAHFFKAQEGAAPLQCREPQDRFSPSSKCAGASKGR